MAEIKGTSGHVYTRCSSCYGILDYVYHVFWCCRSCGKWEAR